MQIRHAAQRRRGVSSGFALEPIVQQRIEHEEHEHEYEPESELADIHKERSSAKRSQRLLSDKSSTGPPGRPAGWKSAPARQNAAQNAVNGVSASAAAGTWREARRRASQGRRRRSNESQRAHAGPARKSSRSEPAITPLSAWKRFFEDCRDRDRRIRRASSRRVRAEKLRRPSRADS